MSAIDERIVSLKFNNSQFESGITTSLASLNKLNSSLKLEGATKGIDAVSKAGSRFSLAGMLSGVETLTSKFGILGVAGVTAIANISNRVVNAGVQLVKSLSISPVLDGYREYETKLGSIQTILANTGLTGAKGLSQVTKVLNDLNTYSDKTIYNFGEMAKNIGTFTAAGVGLKDSQLAIKGIANLAALSGSNSQQASTAMYQLSQSLAAGKVNLQDWNSVVNAGMGGKIFQNAIIDTARVHGVAIDDIIKKEGSFRQAISSGFLSSDILLESLKKFTGSMSEEQLIAKGYTKEQAAAIVQTAKTAQDAATKVKTASQLLDTLKEAVGSGWAQTFELIFGNFDQAKTLFTGISNVVGGFINANAKARNAVIKDWAKMGGRAAVLQSIVNIFHAIIAVVTPIHEAFRDIFPAKTGKDLADISKSFLEFTKGLKLGADTVKNIKSTFRGLFAFLDIGRMIVVAAAKAFISLFQGAGNAAGDILGVTGSLGEFIVKLRDSIKQGKVLETFFGKIASVIRVPINLLSRFVSLLATGFNKINFGAIGSGLKSFADSVSGPLDSFSTKVGTFFSKIDGLAKAGLKKFFGSFGNFGTALSAIFGGANFDSILHTINTGLFATLVFAVRGFIKKITGALKGADPSGGLFQGIKASFNELTTTLQSMQNALKATTLLEIALALGILTTSIVALSKIDSAGLAKALSAITVMFTQLGVAMAVFGKFSGGIVGGKLAASSAALILLAVAIRILASSVKTLSGLNWQELAKGLVGVGGLLASLALFTKFADVSKGGIRSGAGLILLAVAIKLLVGSVKALGELKTSELTKGLVSITAILAAFAGFSRTVGNPVTLLASGVALIEVAAAMKIMASAMKDFAAISVTDIAKGLGAMSGALLAIGLALNLIPPTAPIQATGIVIVAAALVILANATKKFGNLNLDVIGKGLGAMAGVLTAIGIALTLIPATSVASATGILIVAASLAIIAPVLERFGKMDWKTIAKALTTLAGALAIISIAMSSMTFALPGAAALLIVATALAILTPVLLALGNMSWESIAKGLVVLAGALTIIGVAGLLIGPLTPALIGLGAAIALLGAAVLLAGVGVLAFGVGLGLVAAAGAGAAAALAGIIKTVIGLLPQIVKALADVLVQMLNIIIKTTPLMAKAITTVITAIIKVVVTLIPQVVAAIVKLGVALLAALVAFIPKLVEAGFKMLMGILNGIKNNIQKIVVVAGQIIQNFLKGLQQELPGIVDQGVKTVIAFINSVADAIDAHSAELGAAAVHLGVAIVKGIVKGIAGGVGEITKAAGDLAGKALSAAKNKLGIHSPSKEFQKLGEYSVQGFLLGLQGSREEVKATFSDMVGKLKDAMQSSSQDVTQAEEKLKRLTSARHLDKDAIKEARTELALAQLEHAKEASTLDLVTDKTKNHRAELLKLSSQYDAVTAKIDVQNQKLKDAIALRDSFAKTTTDQFSALPDFMTNKDFSLDDAQKSLTNQVDEVATFEKVLQQLRQMGLNDQLYKELLAKGPAAMKFATDLLAAGSAEIKVFNALSDSLTASAQKLGDEAAKNLYQAGIDSITGLIKGLTSQKDKLENSIEDLANLLVNAIKKKLGIKSPSRVFAEVGAYTVQGFTEGIIASTPTVESAAGNLGKAAILGLSKTITGLSDMVSNEMDINPTITPVVDLTGVKKSASDLNSMLDGSSVKIDGAFSSASDASRGFDSNQIASTDQSTPVASSTVEFNQYNTSPKALSEAEIYRQTKNQLSAARGALK